jgi:hypothetical protein
LPRLDNAIKDERQLHMSSARRAFGAGEMSAKAFRKYLQSTSIDGQELHADDGDDRGGGPSEYDTGHAIRERRRGGWLKHPEPDFGPSDLASRG